MMIKHFLLNFFGGQNVRQNGNFCLYFEIVEKDPFLRLQMGAKEMFNRHQFFFTNEQ